MSVYRIERAMRFCPNSKGSNDAYIALLLSKKKGRNKKKKTYSLKYILSRSNKIKLFKRGMVLIQRDN